MKYEACSRHLLTTFATILDPNRQGAAIEIGVGTQEYYFVDFVKRGFPTLAVEPMPTDDLVRSCQQFQVPLEAAAISDKDGPVTLYLGEYEGDRNINLNSLNPDWWGVATQGKERLDLDIASPGLSETSSPRVQVPSFTLKSLLQKWAIERVSILKLDTEGSELAIIQGLREIAPAQLPDIVQFEYGGGGSRQSQQGGWTMKYFNSAIASLEILKSLGYQWILLIDWHLPVVKSFSIAEIENFAEIFHPISHVGNAILCKNAQLVQQINLEQLCQPYVDFPREFAKHLVQYGSNEEVHSFKWILPYAIVQQYRLKRRPLRVLEYGPGCNSEQFIASLICKQIVSIEDNEEWYHTFAYVWEAAREEIDIDYQLIDVTSYEGKAYCEGHCWTEEEILSYVEYPLKYGRGYFDIIFIDAGDRQDEVTIKGRTYSGWPIRNLALELAHSLLSDKGVAIVHDVPGPFPEMTRALASNIHRFNYTLAVSEFCTTVLSDTLDLTPLANSLRQIYSQVNPQPFPDTQAKHFPTATTNYSLGQFSAKAENSDNPQLVTIPRITMSTLGSNGRFANQLFQYAFLKLYANKHHLHVETPDWIGQQLFGHQDPPISRILPEIRDRSKEITDSPILNAKSPVKDVDIWGYFQFHTCYYASQKAAFKRLFQPIPEIESKLTPALNRLRAQGKTVVGLHIRRKDYGFSYFFVTPIQWYKDWLSFLWKTLENPVLFVASDDLDNVVDEFSDYHPVTAKKLGVQLPEAEFYPDFYLLSHCDIVGISNSTFSFIACMLNEEGKQFWRPDLGAQKLVPFNPWDSEPILRDNKVGNWTTMNLCPLRKQIADRWLNTHSDRLEMTYRSGVGKDHRILLQMGVQNEPATDSEITLVEELNANLAKGLSTPDKIRYLLAAMLYYPAHQLPFDYQGTAIPKWFFQDFWQFMLSIPRNFPNAESTNNYLIYLEGLFDYIYFNISRNPTSPVWRYVAQYVAKFNNLDSLGGLEKNIAPIVAKRAEIIEFSLTRGSQAVDRRALR